ncbi:MAG TPA: class I SAM-dependent methyltransferase [Actinomycetota bacterium]|nr:class I SAM-dependent methyltransferase [Actinomycetota bacterium]
MSQPALYRELAPWFHLLTHPGEYAEEAETYRALLVEGARRPVRTVLELGSGGGNNASHMKAHFRLTLVDLSEDMLAQSRALNPECEHIQGDMRTVRVGRTFDGVFVHDAIDYVTTEAGLRAAIATAYEHCAPGGVALFVPDHVRETFEESTQHGGNDGRTRALRYVMWTWDPDPCDTEYVADFAYLLRDETGSVRAVHDRHVCGMFERATWLRLLADAGFEPEVVPARHDEAEGSEIFMARRPGS